MGDDSCVETICDFIDENNAELSFFQDGKRKFLQISNHGSLGWFRIKKPLANKIVKELIREFKLKWKKQ